MSCFESFDRMCKRIVCPNRLKVNQRDILQREVRSTKLQYKLFTIKNSRGQSLSCLIFIRDLTCCPTVLYLHGNGGSKLELLPIIRADIQNSTNFCAFDFSGCGKSEGEYITYGQNEVDDIFTVMNYLTVNFGIKEFHLWGRSMGATSAILCGSYDKSKIASMVLDSPFDKLEKVIENVSRKESFPHFVYLIAIYFIKSRVQEIVKEDIFEENFKDALKRFNNTPLLFAYSQRDQVVLPEDVMAMYQAYEGEKKCTAINSNHAEERSVEFVAEALKFVQQKSNKFMYSTSGSKSLGGWGRDNLFNSKKDISPQVVTPKISLNNRKIGFSTTRL